MYVPFSTADRSFVWGLRSVSRRPSHGHPPPQPRLPPGGRRGRGGLAARYVPTSVTSRRRRRASPRCWRSWPCVSTPPTRSASRPPPAESPPSPPASRQRRRADAAARGPDRPARGRVHVRGPDGILCHPDAITAETVQRVATAVEGQPGGRLQRGAAAHHGAPGPTSPSRSRRSPTRRGYWRSTPRSRRPGPASAGAASRSWPRRSGRWPTPQASPPRRCSVTVGEISEHSATAATSIRETSVRASVLVCGCVGLLSPLTASDLPAMSLRRVAAARGSIVSG